MKKLLALALLALAACGSPTAPVEPAHCMKPGYMLLLKCPTP